MNTSAFKVVQVMLEKFLDEINERNKSRKVISKMTPNEIDQFLTHARVGRIGLSLKDGPYVVPVGYCWEDGRIFFHSCFSGTKMDAMRRDPRVCFQVDESLSDGSMYKSVMIRGDVEIIDDPEEMVPYLQSLIDKYRVPVSFDEYISRPGRSREKEMAITRVCVIKTRELGSRRVAAV